MPVKFSVKVVPADWQKMVDDQRRTMATAAVAALRETAANAVQEGRRNIASAGPGFLRAQWLSGLQYLTKGATEGGASSIEAKATIFHRYGIAGVFEHGATIQGKPLLWIPTKHGGPPARKFAGKLTSATVRGTPMLFDASDKDRHRKPLYIGVPSVSIPKKFGITEIVKKHVARFASIFLARLKKN